MYVDLQYDEISLSFTAVSVCLCGVCSSVVVFGLSVRLLWYPNYLLPNLYLYVADIANPDLLACVCQI